MRLHHRLTHWLERNWVSPAYSGWLLIGLSLFFFGAATNTMAGWLYVISGTLMALLVIAAVLPAQVLRPLRVERSPIVPVHSGDTLSLELHLFNASAHPQRLVLVRDWVPPALGNPVKTAVDLIPARGSYRWVYNYPAVARGIYRWQHVELRTATPLGLFWCCRPRSANARAVVYPRVLPLARCPLIDDLGQNLHQQVASPVQARAATTGVTRTLRPYRWGDATRLIHWRSSARYGELRVRELETYTGGRDIVIGLDSALYWPSASFEQAVVAAASLYRYAQQQQLRVSLWTAKTGLVQTHTAVLETLAATQPQEAPLAALPRDEPLLWLTADQSRLSALSVSSRWLLWVEETAALPQAFDRDLPCPGLIILSNTPLPQQLQSALRNG
ncbi:MAG: DUF58 domain-containing protein [Synechococcales cyanobacterium C42_A2020_086]|jgi:uncharacterized protein (DUF58 family)|nr:DUF58 domain-containing protein [Synechococcales cyanobacterium C42_A2020_086]